MTTDLMTGPAATPGPRSDRFIPGVAPWEGVGHPILDVPGSAEAIVTAGLDWQVEQWPVQVLPPGGAAAVRVRGMVANVRGDTRSVLGIVSRRYQPFQNAEAFAFADDVVGEGGARYETAGAFGGGRRVWMLLRLNEELRAGREDLVRPYLLIYNTFDGSSALRALLTSVRVVCQNTLVLALQRGRGEGITIRHRGDLGRRVADARQALGLVRRRLHCFEQEIEAMRAIPMTGRRLQRYFDTLLPPVPADAGPRQRGSRSRRLDLLQESFASERNRLPGIEGTLWAALNAATEFADHQQTYRGATAALRRERRLDSVWFGTAHTMKEKAYRLARELAELN